MERQDITLSIPKDVLEKAKRIAVERHTSLSGLLTGLLEDLLRWEQAGAAPASAAYAAVRRRHLALLERGLDLGTGGRINWRRDDLHER